jgi:Fungal specific transcription factor domain
LLHQPEPATRIALWVKDIFPNLRRALNDPTKIVSNSNLATAIMLTSLEIISPKAFGIDVPWQQHLNTARQILVWRSKYMQRDHSAVSDFLLRWFAYIDVLGSLIGGRAQFSSSAERPLLRSNHADSKWTGDCDFNGDGDYQIDCLLGFTSRCVSILAKIAKLATICDRDRIEVSGDIRPEWVPSEEIRAQAEKLRIDLEAARTNNQVRSCPHLHSAGEAAYQWDTQEMAATNEAYHWAGLIHLDRRILGKASTHHDVQNAVREISGTLYKVRKGSTAEVCLLFPMFTAGCDAKDERQKALIIDRLKGIEEFGMSHVSQVLF